MTMFKVKEQNLTKFQTYCILIYNYGCKQIKQQLMYPHKSKTSVLKSK